MLFNLTSAGRALLNSNPTGTQITRAEFGSGFNYVPATNPTGLAGSLVYTANAVFAPTIQDSNTLRYSVFIPGPVGPFTFGEVALYAGSTLFGVGAQVVQINKTVGATDNQYRLDVFVDLLNGQHFASFEVVSSATRNFFPRVPSVDALIAPHFDTNNAYVVYGSSQAGEGFLAYSDPSGIWSFSNKPHVWFDGAVGSVGDQGLFSTDLVGAEYTGDYTDLVVQFLTGELRGYCRKVTSINSNGSIVWNTLLLEHAKVVAGDQFIVVGPAASVGFAGTHNSLNGLQGGIANEYYHLTAAEHDAVQYPRLKTKVVGAATYTVLATDDDTYIDIAQDCVVSVSNPATSTYPVGGLTVFRVKNAVVTFQSIGGATLNPNNSVVIDCTGIEANFAVVRKAAQIWDLVAPADEGMGNNTGGGNVIHNYTANPRSNRWALPMYSDLGSETGPNANIEASRLSMHEQSLRMNPNALTAAENWDAPALLTWPLALTVSSSSPTGIPNTSGMVSLTITLNGTARVIAVMGSSVQTFGALVAALNASAAAAVPSPAVVTFTLVDGHLVIKATSAVVPTTMVLTDVTLLGLISSYTPTTLSATSVVDAIGSDALALDRYDSNVNAVRVVGPTGIAMGYRSRVSGLWASVFGGMLTSVDGNGSTALGVIGGFIQGVRSLLLGGAHNKIQRNGSAGTVSDMVIMGGTGNTATPEAGVDGSFSLIGTSRNSAVVGSNSAVLSSLDTSIRKDSVALASTSVTMVGENSSAIGSKNITSNGLSKNVMVVNSDTLAVGARNAVVLGQRNLNIVQDSALYYPTGSTVPTKGQVGFGFAVHTSAYGADAALKLTTDAQTANSLNVMQVLNGHGWAFNGTVSANRGSAQFKGWRVAGHLFNILGVVTIQGLVFELISETAEAVNWELDMVVDSTNTDRVYFTLNTAAQVTGLDTVAVSAFITVNSARPLL